MGNKQKVKGHKQNDVFRVGHGRDAIFLKVTRVITDDHTGLWYWLKPIMPRDESFAVYHSYLNARSIKKIKLSRLEKLLLKLLS